MTHVKELLSPYLDGELAEGDRRSVEEHLPDCAECRRELDDLRSVTALVRELPQAPLPAGFMERLRRKERSSETPSPAGSGILSWLPSPTVVRVGAFSCAGALAVLVVWETRKAATWFDTMNAKITSGMSAQPAAPEMQIEIADAFNKDEAAKGTDLKKSRSSVLEALSRAVPAPSGAPATAGVRGGGFAGGGAGAAAERDRAEDKSVPMMLSAARADSAMAPRLFRQEGRAFAPEAMREQGDGAITNASSPAGLLASKESTLGRRRAAQEESQRTEAEQEEKSAAPKRKAPAPFYPIREIKQRKPASGTYATEGFVVKIYACPPCPPPNRCKPCMQDNIVVSETNRLLESYTLTDKELVLFVADPKIFELGKKYRFSFRVLDQKTTGEPLNDLRLIQYALLP